MAIYEKSIIASNYSFTQLYFSYLLLIILLFVWYVLFLIGLNQKLLEPFRVGHNMAIWLIFCFLIFNF